MAEHIVCITATGGIPLLSRTKSGCQPLSFPVIGSLNGVHMFGLNKDVKLQSTITEHHTIVWKMYHESVVLIAVAPTMDSKCNNQLEKNERNSDPAVELQTLSHNSACTVTDDHLVRLLDNVFHSLVLLIGVDDLKNIQNVDRLKRDLRVCYSLVDTFLDTDPIQKRIEKLLLFGDLTRCVDIVLNPEEKVLLDHLQAFVEASDTVYGCLVFDGKVVCATEQWWMLNGQELALLGRLITLLPSSVTSSDIAVYLPYTSPDIPHRLLVFTLVVGSKGGIRTCILCGPEPSLTQVQENLVERFWGPAMKTLQKTCRSEDVPDAIRTTLPSDLLGFLLVNSEARRCLSFKSPPSGVDSVNRRKQQKSINPYETNWIHDKLVDFYKYVVGTSFPLPKTDELHDSDDLSPHTGLAHYRCMKLHKCFALIKSNYQLFAIYSNSAPTYALQGLTERIFEALSKDGLI